MSVSLFIDFRLNVHVLTLLILVVYAAIVHGKSTFLTEFDADPSSPAKDLARVVLDKLDLDQDTKVFRTTLVFTVSSLTCLGFICLWKFHNSLYHTPSERSIKRAVWTDLSCSCARRCASY